MPRSDLLFYGKDLSALIRGCEATLKEEVEQWDRNRILASSESDLVTYFGGEIYSRSASTPP